MGCQKRRVIVMNIDDIKKLHAVIDRREAEWREEQSEPDVGSATRAKKKSGFGIAAGKRFSADRFLGKSSEPSESEKEIPEPPEEIINENKNKNKSENENSEGGKAEIISVIKQNENKHHSWLYNEVLKAINDAAEDNKNTKVIAIFIPVVQSGKEFEDLPIDLSVTLPPISENEIKDEEVHIEDLVEIPELTGTDDALITEEIEGTDSYKKSDNKTEEAEAAENSEIAESVDDIFPPDQEKPDPELAKAYETIKENLDANFQDAEQASETESSPENPEISPLREVIYAENEAEEENENEISEGEEMPHEELSLDESEAYKTVEDILIPDEPNEDETDFSDPLAAIQILGEDSEEEEKEKELD